MSKTTGTILSILSAIVIAVLIGLNIHQVKTIDNALGMPDLDVSQEQLVAEAKSDWDEEAYFASMTNVATTYPFAYGSKSYQQETTYVQPAAANTTSASSTTSSTNSTGASSTTTQSQSSTQTSTQTATQSSTQNSAAEAPQEIKLKAGGYLDYPLNSDVGSCSIPALGKTWTMGFGKDQTVIDQNKVQIFSTYSRLDHLIILGHTPGIFSGMKEKVTVGSTITLTIKGNTFNYVVRDAHFVEETELNSATYKNWLYRVDTSPLVVITCDKGDGRDGRWMLWCDYA